jgi:formylmethanofuran dehydrogenase subunit C
MLTLTSRDNGTIPIEAEVITPDRLAGKSLAEIARLHVWQGNAQLPLAEFFSLGGDAADTQITIEGDCSRVKRLGAGMKSGRLTIHGDAGMHLGAEMTGGDIVVHGRAGDWTGAEMRSGRIHVHGDAGDQTGAAYRGSRKGMRGGVILIEGNAGCEVGANMRRGLIAVGGDTGDFAGVNLLAGSIFMFGSPGNRFGAGMKRGSLVLLGPSVPLLPTFRFACVYQPVFVQIYLRQLRAWNFTPAERVSGVDFARFSGDLLTLGKGEVLLTHRRAF